MSFRPEKSLWDAQKLRALLEEKGLTQKAVAEAIGVTQQTVTFWVSKTDRLRTEPTYTNLRKLCDLFAVHPWHFDTSDAPKKVAVRCCRAKDFFAGADIEISECGKPVEKVLKFGGKKFGFCAKHAASAKRLGLMKE